MNGKPVLFRSNLEEHMIEALCTTQCVTESSFIIEASRLSVEILLLNSMYIEDDTVM